MKTAGFKLGQLERQISGHCRANGAYNLFITELNIGLWWHGNGLVVLFEQQGSLLRPLISFNKKKKTTQNHQYVLFSEEHVKTICRVFLVCGPGTSFTSLHSNPLRGSDGIFVLLRNLLVFLPPARVYWVVHCWIKNWKTHLRND